MQRLMGQRFGLNPRGRAGCPIRRFEFGYFLKRFVSINGSNEVCYVSKGKYRGGWKFFMGVCVLMGFLGDLSFNEL